MYYFVRTSTLCFASQMMYVAFHNLSSANKVCNQAHLIMERTAMIKAQIVKQQMSELHSATLTQLGFINNQLQLVIKEAHKTEINAGFHSVIAGLLICLIF